MLNAVTRDPGEELGRCQLSFLPRADIDSDLAHEQHRRYESVLESLGCNILRMPAEPGLADAVFVEDTAVVLDELAVMCRPGAASRRPEVAGVEKMLRGFRALARIEAPGTLDGGDVLCAGRIIWAGLSSRSNHEGIWQLQDAVSRHGYAVHTIDVTRCLHLKSAVSLVAPDTLLVNPEWIDGAEFRAFSLLEVDPGESHAANVLLIAGKVICPSSFPRTRERLQARGIETIPVDVSELQKAEGGVTCCSLVFH